MNKLNATAILVFTFLSFQTLGVISPGIASGEDSSNTNGSIAISKKTSYWPSKPTIAGETSDQRWNYVKQNIDKLIGLSVTDAKKLMGAECTILTKTSMRTELIYCIDLLPDNKLDLLTLTAYAGKVEKIIIHRGAICVAH